MIDLATEKLLTLEQAAEKLMVTKQVVTKWIMFGSKGLKLEAIKFGTHWRTSEEALQRFGDRQTPNYESTSDPELSTISSSPSQGMSEAKRDRLDELLGIRKCEMCRKIINTTKKNIPKNERLWCPDCVIKLPSSTLGQRLRTFRWDAGLAQDDLAWKIDISIEFIRAYEKNEKTPKDAHMAKLIEVFGEKLVSGMEKQVKDGSETEKTKLE